MHYGYKLDFLKIPVFNGIKKTRVPPSKKNRIPLEIENLLEKKAIEKVDKCIAHAFFFTTLYS
jgi:hypothetical protein